MSEDHSVDFLKKKYKLAPEQEGSGKPKKIARWIGGFIAIAAIAGVIFSYRIAETQIGDAVDNGNFSFFSTFRQLVTAEEKALPGEKEDRINFLLMGVGGEGHAGPELSDTLIFASYKPSTNDIGMLSIPRDTIVPIEGYGYRKINHVNAYAELEEPGSGLEVTKQTVGDLLDQEIHYAVKVDFQGFQDSIDAVDGVDVYVERSFTDYQYPTWDDLYQTVSFEEGWQHMDGSEALQYARSRHGNNGEGSDFARAKRQQKVILATKEKVLSPGTFLNPTKLNKLIETFQNNVKTDMTFWEMTKLAQYAPDISAENVHHYVLDSSPDSPLYSSTLNGAYVLLPKEDDWSEVRTIAENIFEADPLQDNDVPDPVAQIVPAAVEIQNGTSVTGLAFQTSQMLASSGFEVVKIGNADARGYEQTVIYDFTEGEKSDELELLKEYLEADISNSEGNWAYSDDIAPSDLTIATPGEDYVTTSEPIDFLIILGQNASELVMR